MDEVCRIRNFLGYKRNLYIQPIRCRQRFPETLVSSLKTKRCHNPKDHALWTIAAMKTLNFMLVFHMMYYCYFMAVRVLDFRMKMMPKVRRGKRNKIITVASRARMAPVHCCSPTVMLPVTSSSILTSVLDTGVTLPPRCVWRGKYNCHRISQSG